MRWSQLFLLPLVGLVSTVGCKAESDTGASPCARATTQLRSCGLLSEGTFECGDVTPCEFECLLSATCQQLEVTLCPSDLSATDPVILCLESCRPSFSCGSGEELAEWMHCDGYADCTDSSDEIGCPVFLCPGGPVLPAHSECDGYPECADGSDEIGCALFACANGATVPEDFACDGYPDCADGSDEADCTTGPAFTCRNGDVFPESARCDEQVDCSDGSDELGCPPNAEIVCPAGA